MADEQEHDGGLEKGQKKRLWLAKIAIELFHLW